MLKAREERRARDEDQDRRQQFNKDADEAEVENNAEEAIETQE